VPCTAPSGSPYGYDLVASDGGVFNYGNLPFCGSTGNLVLTAPVVGIATTHDGGGYWEVASDGGCSPSTTPGTTAPWVDTP